MENKQNTIDNSILSDIKHTMHEKYHTSTK